MLGQQFFGVEKYASYINENVIPFYANTDEDAGEKVEDRYEIGGGPSIAIVQNDGDLFDIITSYDNNPDKYLKRVRASLSGKNAYATLKAVADKNPDDLNAKFALAIKHVEMWQSDKSTAISKQILKRADDAKQLEVPFEGEMYNLFEMATFGVANGEMYQKRTVDGMEKFRADFPNSQLMPIVFSELANMYGRLKVTDKGMNFYQEAVVKYSDDANILRGFVRYCIKGKKNLELAESHAGRMVQLRPESAGFCQSAADLYLLLKKEDEAISVYGGSYINDYLDNTGMLNSYSWFWAMREVNLENALQMIQRGAEIDKTDDNLLDTMSMVYWKMKNYKKAIEVEERALKMQPGTESYIERINQIKKDMDKVD